MFNIVRPDTNFNFVCKRHLWMALSVITIVTTIVLFFTKGLNYGIDFTGGAELKVQVPADWNTEKIRNILQGQSAGDLKILTLGDPSENTYLIRVQQNSNELNAIVKKITDALKAQPGGDTIVMKGADIVGPSAGGLLRKNGLLACFYALVSILIYVAIRFDFRFAPGAVLALFHDSIIVIGVFIVTRMEFDLTVLAAILALIGYSNNDTIIVYDRVRETMKLNPNLPIEEIVNVSVNQTLGRTLMTSFATFVTVVALYVFGGTVLKPFAFAYMCGIVVGTYSSIFIASSVVIFITHYQKRKDQSGKKKKKRELKLSPEAHLGL